LGFGESAHFPLSFVGQIDLGATECKNWSVVSCKQLTSSYINDITDSLEMIQETMVRAVFKTKTGRGSAHM